MSEDALRQELEYYKRQLDELTGENLRLDYAASGLRHEVVQKRAAFAILSELQQKIGAHTQISSIFELVVPAVNATLGMERTVVLMPTAEEHAYRPGHWIGYRGDEAAKLATARVELPAAIADTAGTLIVNKSTPRAPWLTAIQDTLQLPYFVIVPVAGEQAPIAWLVSGRLSESRPLYPPLDRGDLEAFQSIAGLISASIRTMRVMWLEESSRLKSEFFANISHEFRTPLTLTIGPLEQILSGRLGEISEDVRDRLLMIRRNQERLLNLVDQVLDLAKVEAGGARLEARRTTDVNRALERRLAPFVPIAEQRALSFALRLDPAAERADLYLDREMFDKLVTNLVANAFKFTRHGSIEVATRIREDGFILEVNDTGVGIKADQLPHIFDRFRQADGSESREFAGTGIGLALAKEVAALHGGEITVLSEYGKGSSFRVRLPLGRDHLDASCIREEPVAESDPPHSVSVIPEGLADLRGVDALNLEAEQQFDRRRATVVYAEDNADLREHVRSVLAQEWNVFVAADGQQALRFARHYAPDLIVTDQMMPRVSGRDLLRAIRADEALRDTPVLFLTARAGADARVESLESGADDYVTKPFHDAELRARVANLLRARQQAREIEALNHRLEARVETQIAELVRAGELLRFLPKPAEQPAPVAPQSTAAAVKKNTTRRFE